MKIREAQKSDFEFIWPILSEVFEEGDTYVYTSEISKKEMYNEWMEKTKKTFVVIDDGKFVGTYFIKENFPGNGSHICNAGFVVGKKSRGKGIGKLMCADSLIKAKEFGFIAMQFNIVVSSNSNAIKLWEEFGFKIVGTIPKGFNDKKVGFIDSYIMYKEL